MDQPVSGRTYLIFQVVCPLPSQSPRHLSSFERQSNCISKLCNSKANSLPPHHPLARSLMSLLHNCAFKPTADNVARVNQPLPCGGGLTRR